MHSDIKDLYFFHNPDGENNNDTRKNDIPTLLLLGALIYFAVNPCGF